MNRFFPNINSVNMTNLQINDIGEYSITRPDEADLITQIIIMVVLEKTVINLLIIILMVMM